VDENYELFPGRPQTPERHALLQRAAKAKPKRERLRWHNLELEPVHNRVGPFRFWLEPATLTQGAPEMQILELYCQNEACRFRSINIIEKLVDQPFPKPGQPYPCPGCGEPAKLMWRVDEKAYREQRSQLFDAALGPEREPEPETEEDDAPYELSENPFDAKE